MTNRVHTALLVVGLALCVATAITLTTRVIWLIALAYALAIAVYAVAWLAPAGDDVGFPIRGSMATSFVSRQGLPWAKLAIDDTAVTLWSPFTRSQVPRSELRRVELWHARPRFLMPVWVVFRLTDGFAHTTMFMPFRRQLVAPAVQALGIPVEYRRLTLRARFASDVPPAEDR